MARLRILSGRGGPAVEWSPGQFTAGEGAAIAAVKAARETFEAARQRGGLAFRLESGQPPRPLDRFDPTVEEIVVVARVAGGAISNREAQIMTQAGMARLEDELERLRTVQRSELAERLRDARESPGDQSDNLELLEAQRDYSLLEARIADLEFALAQAQVADRPSGDLAEVGSQLLVRDEDGEEETYTLVGPAEADPRQGLISIASPVGRALLGTRQGDSAVVETPAGARHIEVLKIS